MCEIAVKIAPSKTGTRNSLTKLERQMALETTLESIAASLAAIANVLQTQAQATTVLGPAEVTTEKKTRAKKVDAPAVPNEPAPTPTPAVEAVPVTAAAPTPAPATPVASTASSQKPWSEVLAKVVEVNKSTLPTAGRKGVEAILAHFFGADVAGKKVPNLEGLNKHDEIVAFADSLLAPAPADDDLGL